MRRFGTDGKRRFSIKYPDGRIERYGTCDPKEDERFGIVCIEEWYREPLAEEGITGKRFFLAQYQKDDINYTQPIRQRFLLPDGVLVANGYYNNEHDEFITPEEWINQDLK